MNNIVSGADAEAQPAAIHPLIAAALAPFAPPQSSVHRDARDAIEADLAYAQAKASGALDLKNERRALLLQIKHQ